MRGRVERFKGELLVARSSNAADSTVEILIDLFHLIARPSFV